MHDPPIFGLVGAGHFGRRHLYELEKLQRDGKLELAGIVVASDASREKLQSNATCPVFTSLEESFLQQLDCIDIVTHQTPPHEIECDEKFDERPSWI